MAQFPVPETAPYYCDDPNNFSLYQMLQKQLATVFLKLDEIKEEQQVQRRILSSIQKKVGDTAQVEDVELPHGCRFPLEAMDQLDRLEAMLSENSNLQKDLIRQLALIGGTTVNENTRRVMGHVMKNQLARQLNWAGKAWGDKQRKRAFCRLLLNDLVTKSVLKNTAFKATELDVNNAVKVWLRNSCSRDGGRTKRAIKRPHGHPHAPHTAHSSHAPHSAHGAHMGMPDICFKP